MAAQSADLLVVLQADGTVESTVDKMGAKMVAPLVAGSESQSAATRDDKRAGWKALTSAVEKVEKWSVLTAVLMVEWLERKMVAC